MYIYTCVYIYIYTHTHTHVTYSICCILCYNIICIYIYIYIVKIGELGSDRQAAAGGLVTMQAESLLVYCDDLFHCIVYNIFVVILFVIKHRLQSHRHVHGCLNR